MENNIYFLYVSQSLNLQWKHPLNNLDIHLFFVSLSEKS